MFQSIPVAALRTFEAAARHRSFRRAADELAVTPTAVSHRIRKLEHRLGVALFRREPRGVSLSAAGERLFRRVHGALLDIAQTLDELRPAPDPGGLTVTTTHSFAALWLVPRLDRFYAAHPDCQLRLDTGAEVVDLQQDARVDVAIRYGPGPIGDLGRMGTVVERFGVFGAPQRTAAAYGPAGPPGPLITVRWRDSQVYESGWRQWCDAAGLDWLRRGVALRAYQEEHYALQAAIAGHGLVLASSVMVADSLRHGLLVPFRPEITVPGAAYAALCVPGRERHPPVAAFLKWLTTEWQPPLGSANQETTS